MSKPKIEEPNFAEYNGLNFSFNMINYLAQEKYGNPVLNEICATISKCYKSELPISARLLDGHRIYPIPKNHTLRKFLNTEAQRSRNFLVFTRKDGTILVIFFGPFVLASHVGDFAGILTRSHEIFKDIAQAVMLGQDIKATNEEVESPNKQLVENYWRSVEDVLSKIEAKEIELKGFAYEVFDQPTADKLTKKLKASTGKVLVKGVAAVLLAEIAEEIGRKIAAMLAAKTVAKGAAKGGASHTSKAAAKSVPILGLVVGIGFGAWRYLQGDMTGAGLEVMSGAVACVPGGGTATSLAIDAGLVARDVYKAKNAGEKDVKDLKKEMTDIEKTLKDLYDHYDNAMTEYDFVKEIIDVGFTVKNLVHEVKILEEAVSSLNSIYDDVCS